MSQDLHNKALQVFNLVRKNLDDHHMRYQADEAKLGIMLISVGEDLPMPLIIEVMEDRQVLRILSPIPVKMPEEKRVEGAIATCVANYGMINGAFDYDMRDGEIRFRLSSGYHNTNLDTEVITYMIACSLSTIDRYNDRFYALAKGMCTLDEFIKNEG